VVFLQFWAKAADVKWFSIGEVIGPSLTDDGHVNITTMQTVSRLFDLKSRYGGLLFKPTAKTRYRKKVNGDLNLF
jgi:hypothetical protein